MLLPTLTNMHAMRLSRHALMTLITQLLAATAMAQAGTPDTGPADTWQHYYAMLVDDDEADNESAADAFEMLDALAADRMDINTTTGDDLERLPFLTPAQVMDIIEYRDRYGPLRSVAELKLVPSVDAVRCKLLAFFVTAGTATPRRGLPPLDTLLRHSRSELTAAMKIPLYDRRGDKNGYLGPKYKHWMRYRISYGRRIEAGLTASQDAGEPFFAGRNKAGYDFYSPHAVARDMGIMTTGVAGRFRTRFGMGLIMNCDYTFGKSFAMSALTRNTTTLRPHSSRSEAGYLQGAGATLRLSGHADLTAFASYRKVDATLNADSTTVRTLLTSGYHRTPSEMERRRNTGLATGGASLGLHWGAWRVAVAGVAERFSRELRPDVSAAFRRFNPAGRTFANASAAYSYTSTRFTAAGETATAASGGMATLNTITALPSQALTLTLIHRYYSYRYNAIHASAFSDGGRVSNEHGLYVGAAWSATPALTLTAYTDYARSPWPRYLVSMPSTAWDNMLAATWQHGSLSLSGRYRLRLRQRDNEQHDALVRRTEHRARLAAAWRRQTGYVSAQADMAALSAGGTKHGWMVSMAGGLTLGQVSADGVAGYFNTDTYDCRVYMYERGLLYNFSFPSFYGRGIHYALRLRYDMSRQLMLMAKATVTDWFDRSHTGSGLQQVDRSSTPAIEVQLRWRTARR